MEGMFNPLSIGLHMLNTGILFVALYYLLFKPVRSFMVNREEQIAARLKAAETRAEEAEVERLEADRALQEATMRAAQTLEQSVGLAREQAQGIVQRAETEAEGILNQARLDAQSLQESAQAELRDQAAELAVAMAAQLMAHEITPSDHERMIHNLLDGL